MKFIADVHLGKLAKLLRMLGFDVLYDNSLTDKQLVFLSLNEERILLSGNSAFENNKALQSFIVTSQDAETQLRQIFTHFNLKHDIRPFTRCLVCNGTLHAVSKDEIAEQLEPNTKQYFNEFWQCNYCKRIYWKGSHYKRMMKLAEDFIKTY